MECVVQQVKQMYDRINDRATDAHARAPLFVEQIKQMEEDVSRLKRDIQDEQKELQEKEEDLKRTKVEYAQLQLYTTMDHNIQTFQGFLAKWAYAKIKPAMDQKNHGEVIYDDDLSSDDYVHLAKKEDQLVRFLDKLRATSPIHNSEFVIKVERDNGVLKGTIRHKRWEGFAEFMSDINDGTMCKFEKYVLHFNSRSTTVVTYN
jgi:septal ring factor EnvC (AmiA/AmiB activator)